ncbi:MAG: DUF354 domain-containing protein [Candidatus Brockarchaeota archaeon]|nr:DUF354 domain-containing protein [Candidatus Brockarchaeota archaeon]
MLKSFLKEFKQYSIYITGFKRGETVELMDLFGFKGEILGKDRYNPLLKSLSFVFRTFQLIYKAPDAKVFLSFGSTIPPSAKMKKMKTILMHDNDLMFIGEKPFFQKIKNFLQKMADYVLIPEVAQEPFKKYFGEVIPYPGYKEHIYIADFQPNPNFLGLLPFKDYIVVRPESLSSLYVLEKYSIVPEILKGFERESINVVYLPRNREERVLAEGFKNVFTPHKALDGLNLVYYSKATLTGSGTMAREAAVLGVPAVSFFPKETLLSVDKDLVEKQKIFHSRNPEEIVGYVKNSWNKRAMPDLEKAREVRRYVISFVKKVIE